MVRDHATLVVGDARRGRRAWWPSASRPSGTPGWSRPGTSAGVGALGSFQRRNFAVAAAAAEAFLRRELDPEALAAAASETRVPGRLEQVGEKPLTVIDGAHNPAGARALAAALPEVVGERRPRVGVLVDPRRQGRGGHARGAVAGLRPAGADPLRQPARAVAGHAGQPGGAAGRAPVRDGGRPARALERARDAGGPEGAVVATGSIYLVADLVREDGAARASTM